MPDTVSSKSVFISLNDPEQVKSELFSIFSNFFYLIRIFVVDDDVVLFCFWRSYLILKIHTRKFLFR